MAILYGIYAVVLLAGGIMGYVKAKSVPSLVSGIVGGLLMGIATSLLSTQPRTGLGVGIVLSLILFYGFSARYRKIRKAMPSVLIMALSAVVLFASMFTLFPPPHA